jgi:DNA-binding beta-propeller fold protein YncE
VKHLCRPHADRAPRRLLAAAAACAGAGLAVFGAYCSPTIARGASAAGSPGFVQSQSAPGCTQKTAPQRPLSGPQPVFLPVPGYPLGVASSPDGQFSFLSIAGAPPAGSPFPADTFGRLAVLSDASFPPSLVSVVAVTQKPLYAVTVTHDRRYVLAADIFGGVYVLNATAAETGAPGAVLGHLRFPSNKIAAALAVLTSPDDRFVFVSHETKGTVDVFNLARALQSHFHTSGLVGTIPLGRSVVGLAESPNGRWLYATSEIADRNSALPIGVPGAGSLSVINLRQAESTPATALRESVTAGCNPVRVAASKDGKTVWVTARESNALLGFSTARLLTQPARALIADVRVGQAPVPLALVDHDREIVVGDSNRFDRKGSKAQLTVIDTRAALHRKPAILGSLPSGPFPREAALGFGGALLLTNSGTEQIEALPTTAPTSPRHP